MYTKSMRNKNWKERTCVCKNRKEKKGQLHLLQIQCMCIYVFVNLLFVIDTKEEEEEERKIFFLYCFLQFADTCKNKTSYINRHNDDNTILNKKEM